jgi:hypothetical protein
MQNVYLVSTGVFTVSCVRECTQGAIPRYQVRSRAQWRVWSEAELRPRGVGDSGRPGETLDANKGSEGPGRAGGRVEKCPSIVEDNEIGLPVCKKR